MKLFNRANNLFWIVFSHSQLVIGSNLHQTNIFTKNRKPHPKTSFTCIGRGSKLFIDSSFWHRNYAFGTNLGMRATNFDNVLEFLRLLEKSLVKFLHSRKKCFIHHLSNSYVHCRWKGIVGTLEYKKRESVLDYVSIETILSWRFKINIG